MCLLRVKRRSDGGSGGVCGVVHMLSAWYAVSYDSCNATGVARSKVWAYDQHAGAKELFDFTWRVAHPDLCPGHMGPTYDLAMGPAVEVHNGTVWTAMFGRTSYSTTSLLRIDMATRTAVQVRSLLFPTCFVPLTWCRLRCSLRGPPTAHSCSICTMSRHETSSSCPGT